MRLQAGVGFNNFDWIQPSENRLSDIIRELLDPMGSHGQEERFLRLAATEFLGISEHLETAALRNSVTVREARTHRGRRIDLMIQLGQIVIGIENKPFAGEGQDQLQDYATYLSERYPERYSLVFLHGPGMKPNSISASLREQLEKADRFRSVPYFSGSAPSLHGWLLACILACRADKVRWFLIDFADYVLRTFSTSESGVK